MNRTAGLVLVGALCASCADENVVGDCFVTLDVGVTLATTTPAKMEIIWNGASLVNECKGEQAAMVSYVNKQSDRIAFELNWLGSPPHNQANLTIRDLGDCSNAPVTIFEEHDHVIANEPSCGDFLVRFEATAYTSSDIPKWNDVTVMPSRK
jgi:hypothetical protein